jgi:hypothetical protein
MADKGPYGKVSSSPRGKARPANCDKGPWGKVTWDFERHVHANHELTREGSGAPGNAELRHGGPRGSTPSNSELCRPGSIPATMPELDRGKFAGCPFIDNTARNEAMTEDEYNADDDLVPGHKQMAGMP